MRQARTSTPQRATNQPWRSRWEWPIVVADVDALYFPETHAVSEVTKLPLAAPLGLGDTLDFAADYGVGWDGRDVGQVWLTPRMTDRLGLRISADITDELTKLSEDTDATQQQKISRVVFNALTAAGGPVIDDITTAGWTLRNTDRNGTRWLQPRVTVEKNGRVLQVVLTDYALLWDPNASGPYRTTHPLPDADEDPHGYAVELTRRIGRLVSVLRVQWGASAGRTGAGIVDEIRPKTWERGRAQPLPPLDDLAGQNQLEPTWSWHRSPSGSELDNARYLHQFDGRLAWLARAGAVELGVGTPDYILGDEAEVLLRGTRPDKWPAATWQVTLPTWEHASIPAPHPFMRSHEPVQRWITTPSLRLLRADCDLEIPIHAAWVYPARHRCLYAFHRRVREALVGDTKAAQEAAERAEAATESDEKSWWLHRNKLLSTGARGAAEHARQQSQLGENVDHWHAEASTWDAVAASVKDVYSVYLQRLGSPNTARAAENYAHHHQGYWHPAIIAEQRRIDYLKIREHAEATGAYPIAAVRNDEYYYLSASDDPSDVSPDVDTGALGKLRAKQAPAPLTDGMRRALTSGRPVEQVWDRAHKEGVA